MSSLSFDKALEEIRATGAVEKETVEIAAELARIIGELTETRINSGLTQRQLAEKCGIKQSAIARMESLQAIPRLDTMIKIARCLDAKISISTSSEKIVSVGIVFNLQNRTAKSDQYMWSLASSKITNIGFSRKEYAHAAIG